MSKTRSARLHDALAAHVSAGIESAQLFRKQRELFYATLTILAQAVAFVDCEVRQTVDCGGHDLFVGEVVDAGFTKAEDTPVLRMEDTRMSYGG